MKIPLPHVFPLMGFGTSATEDRLTLPRQACLLPPIRLKRPKVDANIGLTDPADTDQLSGLLAAAGYSLSRTSPLSIVARLNIAGPRAEFEWFGGHHCS
jgi:hypothetical protein